MKILLDTHILLYWFSEKSRLSRAHARVIEACSPDHPFHISDISLWEIATLWSLKRISLDLPLGTWLERAASPPLAVRIGISPLIAAQAAALPPPFHRDPADRIILSTALMIGATLLTNDIRIKETGLVRTL